MKPKPKKIITKIAYEKQKTLLSHLLKKSNQRNKGK